MGKAESLLRAYKEDLALLQMFQAKLKHMNDPITNAEIDDYIEGATLKRPPLDRISQHGGNYTTSQTESIALDLHSKIQAERMQSVRWLQQEIERLEYRQSMRDALLMRLSEQDAWIIKNRYYYGFSITKLLDIMPDTVGLHSKTTLCKRCCNALKMLDTMLEK